MAKSKSVAHTDSRRAHKSADAVNSKSSRTSSAAAPATPPRHRALHSAVIDTADAIAAVDHVRHAYDGLRDLLMWQGGSMDPRHLMLQRPQLEGLVAVLNEGLGRAIDNLREVTERALAAMVESRDTPGDAVRAR